MNYIRKTIPEGTKIYTTLSRACRYQQRRPSGVQCVSDPTTLEVIGFAALPATYEGKTVLWFKGNQA